MNKKYREYWRIKNRIGYTVIKGDTAKRKELEQELNILAKKGKDGRWKKKRK